MAKGLSTPRIGALVLSVAGLALSVGAPAVLADTTAPTAPVSTTTSTVPGPGFLSGPSTTTTDPSGGGDTSGGGGGGGAGGSGGAGGTSPGAAGSGGGGSRPSGTAPAAPAPNPALEAEAASVHRAGGGGTAGLLAALTPLSRFGLTPVQMAIVGFGQFPVAGPATYSDDWLEYRSFPTPHLHQGVDIVAAPGTPLRSPTAGVLSYSDSDPDGYGLTALVTAPDRTVYVLAHMSATVLGLSSGSTVQQGQVIGFVGSSGDATGPHCHFEIHPAGGAGVDPTPILDRWVAAATAAAPGLIQAFATGSTAPTPTTAPVVPQSVPAPVPAPQAPRVRASTAAGGGPGSRWPSGGAALGVGLGALVAAGAVVAERRIRRLRLG